MRTAFMLFGLSVLLVPVTVLGTDGNTPPVADAGEDLTGYVGETITLDGSATDADGDTIAGWLWSVESKPAGSDPYLSNPYEPDAGFAPDVSGDYVLSLVAWDGTDESEPDTVKIHAVPNQAPVAVVSVDVTSGPAPLTVSFDGSGSYDPEGRPLVYDWSFGDNSVPGSSEESPVHVYQSSGTYLAELVVYDDQFQTAYATVAITVTVPPDIEVAPTTLDFGDEVVNGSSAQMVTVSNLGPGILEIQSIGLKAGSSSAFSITNSPGTPELDQDETLDVQITFAPTSTGVLTGTLEIESNDPDEGTVEIALTGTGVETQPSIPDLIDDILAFFDASVADGTLYGLGSGNSAANRRNALRNMIEAAGDLLREEEYDRALDQLAAACQKTDGTGRPPDFVGGTSADDLADMILEVIDLLE